MFSKKENKRLKKLLRRYTIIFGIIFLVIAIAVQYDIRSKRNPLDNVEKRLDEAQQKQSVLTENEKKLKTDSETKEWEEIDK